MRRLARCVLLIASLVSTMSLGGCDAGGVAGPGDGYAELILRYECSTSRELIYWIDGGQTYRGVVSNGDERSYVLTAVNHLWSVNAPDRSVEWGPEYMTLENNSVHLVRLTC